MTKEIKKQFFRLRAPNERQTHRRPPEPVPVLVQLRSRVIAGGVPEIHLPGDYR